MLKIKALMAVLAAAVMLTAQVAVVYAQDPTPAPPITGTVDSITLQTDASGNTIVVVTLTDETGAMQTLNLSAGTAVALGLVTLDASGNPVVNDSAVGQGVSVDPATVLPTQEAPKQPVADAIATFFADSLGLDYNTVIQHHDDGMGFGEIAQACWMSFELQGDAAMCGQILDAKKSGDYSGIVLPDGSTPTNWGQFKKAVQGDHENLGSIMSGKAQANPGDNSSLNGQGTGESQAATGADHGNGHAKSHSHGHGHGK